MRLFTRALVCAAAATGLLVGSMTPAAQAAVAPATVQSAVAHSAVVRTLVAPAAKKSAPLTVKKIPNKTVKAGRKATVKPNVAKAKSTKIMSSRLTVKRGNKTLAKNKASLRLAVGTYKVTTTVKFKAKGKKGIKVASLSQTLKVKQASSKRPSVAPNADFSCPSGYPIKGNASSRIYHLPGGQYYERTNPEQCFASTAAARAAGYRASKR